MTTNVFIPNEQKKQSFGPVEIFADFGLDRSSLPLLIEVIDALEDDRMFDEAAVIIDNLADHHQISQFVHTLFKHAGDGYVQLRQFIDLKPAPHNIYGYPWPAVHVGDLDKLAEIATKAASFAARSPEKVNFCPPVATFIGTGKGTQGDLCQGLAVMVELDERPGQSRDTLENLLGEPTLVVKSGGTWTDPETGEVQDRCHLYWRLSAPVLGNDARLKQCRTWASDLVSSDPTGKPVNHPLRWPGSWHKKGEPRLCQISGINDTVEIDIEFAHATLKDAAAQVGLRVEQDDVRPREPHATNPDADWHMDKPGPQAVLEKYLSRTCNRRSALMGFASGVAMSAVHAGSDLSIGELAGIVENAHHANPSTSKRTSKEFSAMSTAALDWANQHVSQPTHIKKAEWDAYLQSDIDRIEREIREADEEAAARDGDADYRAADDDEPDEPPEPEGPAQPSQTPAAFGDANAKREPSAEPIDIFGSLSPKPVLTPEMLPETIADFAFDEAARMGVDPAMIAIPCLIVCAAAIDDGIRIQPKAEDTEWTESARLWGAAIGEPGVMKTPSLNKAVKPLQSVEEKWRTEDTKLFKAYEAALEDYKYKKATFDKARRNGKDCEEPQEPERPPKRRCVVNEMSMEGLAERILADNTRGVLVLYNELMALIGGFDAYKNNGAKKDRAAALELFDGGPRNRDLVRDTVWVPNWNAGILGGIQTDKLAKVALSLGDDGLLQRFLLFEVHTAGMGEDRKPDMEAIGAYQWLVHQLAHLRADGETIMLSSEAQEYRKEVHRIAFALKEEKSLPAAFRGHANKLHGIFARLLLTLHLIETPHRRTDLMLVVSGATAKRARDLMVKFFIPQALDLYRRFFGADGVSDAQWVAGHILAHQHERVSERDLYRADKKYENDRSRLGRAIATLVEYNWLEPMPPRRPGDKPNGWRVNPLVHSRFAERAEQERTDRQAEQKKAAEGRKIISNTFSIN